LTQTANLLYFLSGSFLSFVFFAVLFFWYKKHVKKQITVFAQNANRYATGNLSERIQFRSDNFQMLADAINQMIHTLRNQIGEKEEEKAKVSAILENMTDGVMGLDEHKNILIANSALENILNIRKNSILGRNVLSLLRNPKVDSILEEVIKHQSILTEEIAIHHPEKMLRISAIGIPHSKSSILGILVVSDITEVRRLENLRREFVANVSHELKTPLTSIKGFIETLLSGAISDTDRAKSFLKIVEEDTNRLTRLIDELLELSKIESKRISLKMEKLDLKKEIAEALSVLRTAIDEKKIKVENKIDSFVSADRDRLKQILINLTENAIKFNKPGGSITFTASPVGNQVKITVTDTGIGISKEMIPRIFERFFRADKARSRDLGGTGLGLSIVKHLVEAHGGEISCDSQIGKCSTFFFTLPQAKH